MKWKIYYENGSAYSNEDGDIFFAPTQGVQIVCFSDEDVGRRMIHRFDYYWPTTYGFSGGDLFALYEYLTGLGPKKVFFGKTVSDKTFKEILDKVLCDCYFPPKSAKHTLEK